MIGATKSTCLNQRKYRNAILSCIITPKHTARSHECQSEKETKNS